MENAPVIYDLIEQLERIADQLGRMADVAERVGGLSASRNDYQTAKMGIESPSPESFVRKEEYLSRFLEILPTWNYNCLRRKMIPASMAAKLLGVSPAQLTSLTDHGRIKSKAGRYDLMSLLMWLDSVVSPTTEFDDAA